MGKAYKVISPENGQEFLAASEEILLAWYRDGRIATQTLIKEDSPDSTWKPLSESGLGIELVMTSPPVLPPNGSDVTDS